MRHPIIALLLALGLTAAGAPARAQCTVEPDSLNFGSAFNGEPVALEFVLTNGTAGAVAGEITRTGPQQNHYRFAGGAPTHPYALAPGESDTVTVVLTATYQGPFDAALDLGTLGDLCGLPPVACHGYGQYPPAPGVPECTVPHYPLEFPPTTVGEQAVETLWIINSGGDDPAFGAGILTGTLPGGCGPFHIPWAGPYAITGHHTYDLVFAPTEPGYQSCLLDLPDLCRDLELRGMGLQVGTLCEVSTAEVDFGAVRLGRSGHADFRVLNLGTEDLVLQIPLSCGPFAVTAGGSGRVVAPGEEHFVAVSFTPDVPGHVACELDLGLEACGTVTLTGTGLEDPGGSDLVGVWFDASGALNRHVTTAPYEPVTAYLLILGPSTEYGALGWECCVEVDGDVLGVAWDLAGDAINVEAEPCFAVGLGSGPLLGADFIRLATLSFVQVDPDAPTAIYIHPTSNPSLPGVPSYVDGADPGHLIPLAWSSGTETVPVAVVNEDVTRVPRREAHTELRPPLPNPFNPATTLRFELAKTGGARLGIFDLEGRRVRTLVDGVLPAGGHERRWDGRDGTGRPLPSGVYFARLEAGGVSRLQKLLLLK